MASHLPPARGRAAVPSRTPASERLEDGGDAAGSRCIGNYILGKRVGKGTFGKVKLGIHKITKERVAIKILEKSKIKDSADVERVRREIRIFKKVQYPYITQLYEIIDTPNHIYLIMEYAESGELFDYIVSHGRVNEMDACRFFHMIIDAVDYCHRLNIIHRDLKPENILLDGNRNTKFFTVKLIDFGLSNTDDGNVLLKTACGSPCYAAPEMIAGKKYQGPLADIWSLGVVLFAMVCGYLPFEDENTSILYKKILRGKYEVPAFLSSDVKDLLRRILEVRPEKRFRVSDIRSHRWYTQSQVPVPPLNLREDKSYIIPVDERLLLWAKDLGFDMEQTRESLLKHLHNPATSTYYLLQKKVEREGFPASRHSAALPSSLSLPSTPITSRSPLTFASSPVVPACEVETADENAHTDSRESVPQYTALTPDPLSCVPGKSFFFTPHGGSPPATEFRPQSQSAADSTTRRPPTAPPTSPKNDLLLGRPVLPPHTERFSHRPTTSSRSRPKYGGAYVSPYTQSRPSTSRTSAAGRGTDSESPTPSLSDGMALSGTQMPTTARSATPSSGRNGRRIFTRSDDVIIHFQIEFADVLKKVLDILKQLEIGYRLVSTNSLICEKMGITMELSIRPTQKEGVRRNTLSLHKLAGEDWIYKQLSSNLVTVLRL